MSNDHICRSPPTENFTHGRDLIILFMIGLCLVLGCSRNNISETDKDAPKTERGRLKFAKGLHSLRIGDRYVFRDVTQYFFFEGKPWEPADDKTLADRINWCDTSPNPEVEILRCFSDASENYRYTYILRVKDDKPEVVKIDESLGSVWIDADGRWLLFRKFFQNVETDEKIPVKGMPFVDDPSGSAPVTYVLGVSPDKKTVVAGTDLAAPSSDPLLTVTLRVIDTETGSTEARKVSLAKYPWLKDHEDPANNMQPPPAASTKFVWKKDSRGRDRLDVPEPLETAKLPSRK